MTEVRSDSDVLVYGYLSMLLGPPGEPKVVCNDQRRNKWGHVAVSCTHGIGHLGPHHDAHAARSWED